MNWIPIGDPSPNGLDAQSEGVVLLKGTIDRATLTDDEDSCFPRETIRVVGYWDSIDSAWALTSTPWYGPFFNPTHYAVFPESLEIG